jgi:carbon-monoxide dehydrogenase medium subunit
MKYFRPSTVNDVVAGLARGGVLLAGGTVLVPALVSKAETETSIWDLQQIAALNTISSDSGFVRIGATVSLTALHSSSLVASELPALAEAAAAVGNPQVRNAGTLGGNLATPHTDLPPALLVLEAEVIQAGPEGEFSQPIEQFLKSGATGLITEVRIARKPLRRSRFVKYAWRASSGRTIVSVAGAISLENGKITEAKLVAGGISNHPCRLNGAEKALLGQTWGEGPMQQAARAGAEEAVVEMAQSPGEQYRRHLVASGVRQVLKDMTKA